MKLILQIAAGVFLGTFATQLILESWHDFQQEKIRQAEKIQQAQREKQRLEQGERIKAMLLNSRLRNNKHGASDFVPDDIQQEKNN